MKPTQIKSRLCRSVVMPGLFLIAAGLSAVPLSWGNETCADALSNLQSSDPSLRRQGAGALGSLSCPDAHDPLFSVLSDSDAPLRALAAVSLGQLRLPDAGPVLSDMISGSNKDSSAMVRAKVAMALMFMGVDDGVPALKKALADEDANVRKSAVRALGGLGFPDAVPALAAMLNDKDPDMRYYATAALGGIQHDPNTTGKDFYNDPKALDILRGLLSDADTRVSFQAAVELAISINHDASGHDILVTGLSSLDGGTRSQAAYALSVAGNSADVPALQNALAVEANSKTKADIQSAIDKLSATGAPAPSPGQ